jgi:succinylarginine dihydrolase
MNRTKLTFAAYRISSGVKLNEGLFDRFVRWLETRYARKLEEYFAPSRQSTGV